VTWSTSTVLSDKNTQLVPMLWLSACFQHVAQVKQAVDPETGSYCDTHLVPVTELVQSGELR
jgi:hypothetical protein